MFVNLKTSDGKELVLNTSQIVIMSQDCRALVMSTNQEYLLDSESADMLKADIFGDGNHSVPRASEHTSTLLNDLHKLLGGRGEAKPTTDRKARLKSRLKDFSEEELKIAAKNCGSDEFMSGVNDQNKKYATIDYLLRTSANVNKWLEAEPQKKRGMF